MRTIWNKKKKCLKQKKEKCFVWKKSENRLKKKDKCLKKMRRAKIIFIIPYKSARSLKIVQKIHNKSLKFGKKLKVDPSRPL